jgi:hypothetical protein
VSHSAAPCVENFRYATWHARSSNLHAMVSYLRASRGFTETRLDKISPLYATANRAGHYGRRWHVSSASRNVLRRNHSTLAAYICRSNGYGSVIHSAFIRNFAPVLGYDRVSNTNWLSLGVLGVAVLTLLTGYLRRPAFVPAARIADLEGIIRTLKTQFDICEQRSAALEIQNKALTVRVEYLEDRVKSAVEEREYWLAEVRKMRNDRA